MIYKYNVPQPLPFYTDINGQNFRRIQCKDDLITFQNIIVFRRPATRTLKAPRLDIKRVASGAAVTQFAVYKYEASGDVLVGSCPTSGWNNVTVGNDGTDDIEILYRPEVYFDPGANLSENVPYYFKVASDGVEYFSEIFYVGAESAENDLFPAACDDGQRFLRLTWENTGGIMEFFYTDAGGPYSLLLPVALGQPTYALTENAKDTGAGDKFKTLVRTVKRFQFVVYAPEYIADVLTAIQNFPTVEISFPNGEMMAIENIETQVNWADDACFCNIVFSFTSQEAYDIKRTGCAS